MSRTRTLKRKDQHFTRTAFAVGLAFILMLFLSQMAAAGPDKMPDSEDTKKVEEAVETVEDAVDMLTPPAEEDAVDAEGTKDIIPATESPVITPDITPAPPAVIMKTPGVYGQGDVMDTAGETVIPAPAPAIETRCYPQQDGTSECICDGEEECATLKSSESCAPGTDWSNEDGLGGCTKKEE